MYKSQFCYISLLDLPPCTPIHYIHCTCMYMCTYILYNAMYICMYTCMYYVIPLCQASCEHVMMLCLIKYMYGLLHYLTTECILPGWCWEQGEAKAVLWLQQDFQVCHFNTTHIVHTHTHFCAHALSINYPVISCSIHSVYIMDTCT